MYKFKQLISLSFSILLFISSYSAFATISDITSLTPQQAYEQGMILRWQNKNEQAKEYFKYAADNGVANAMFMYGLLNRGSIFAQTNTAYAYYNKAASLGHVSAMLALLTNASMASSVEKAKWRDILTRYWLDKVEQGNASAMYNLYYLNHDNSQGMKWLKKAAKAGDAMAQYALAESYEFGDGWFLWPGKREKEIERLYKASAEQGYVRGMDAYAAILHSNGKYGEALSWRKSMADLGDATTIYRLSSMYDIDENYEQYGDKVLAAAYLSIYLQTMSSEDDIFYKNGAKRYPELWASLTDEEKAQAEQFAKEYLATHTVRRFDNFWFMDDEALIPMDKYLPSESVK